MWFSQDTPIALLTCLVFVAPCEMAHRMGYFLISGPHFRVEHQKEGEPRGQASVSPTSSDKESVNPPREYFEEQYAQLSAGLFAEHGDAFPPGIFSPEAFRWTLVPIQLMQQRMPILQIALQLRLLCSARGPICACEVRKRLYDKDCMWNFSVAGGRRYW